MPPPLARMIVSYPMSLRIIFSISFFFFFFFFFFLPFTAINRKFLFPCAFRVRTIVISRRSGQSSQSPDALLNFVRLQFTNVSTRECPWLLKSEMKVNVCARVLFKSLASTYRYLCSLARLQLARYLKIRTIVRARCETRDTTRVPLARGGPAHLNFLPAFSRGGAKRQSRLITPILIR